MKNSNYAIGDRTRDLQDCREFSLGYSERSAKLEIYLAPRLRMSVSPCLLYLHGTPRDDNDLAEAASLIAYSFCVLAHSVNVFVLTSLAQISSRYVLFSLIHSEFH